MTGTVSELMQNRTHLSLLVLDAYLAITGGSSSFERDGDTHPWTIRNRYYEADVGFKIVDSPTHLLDCLRAENGAAAAVILVVDKSKVNIQGASASYSHGVPADEHVRRNALLTNDRLSTRSGDIRNLSALQAVDLELLDKLDTDSIDVPLVVGVSPSERASSSLDEEEVSHLCLLKGYEYVAVDGSRGPIAAAGHAKSEGEGDDDDSDPGKALA